MTPDRQAMLIKCFQAVFPKMDPAQIPAATLDTVENWDSMATITLVNVLEQEFNIQIDPADLESLVSFGAVRDYLATKSG